MKLNQSELDRCKNDPAYFAEKYLGLELKPWQKAYLKLINKYEHVCFVGNRCGKKMLDEILNKHKKTFS